LVEVDGQRGRRGCCRSPERHSTGPAQAAVRRARVRRDPSCRSSERTPGIFKKHGLALDIFYTKAGGETIQVVIYNAAHSGVSDRHSRHLGAYAKGAPERILGSTLQRRQSAFWMCGPDSRSKSRKTTPARPWPIRPTAPRNPHVGAGDEEIHRRGFRADPERSRARNGNQR